jgi:UDP-galactose transporter B1
MFSNYFFMIPIRNIFSSSTAIKVYHAGPDTSPQSMYAIMSFSYLGAMVASNHALQYVSYPTQVRLFIAL